MLNVKLSRLKQKKIRLLFTTEIVYLQQNYIKTINYAFLFGLNVESCFPHTFTMRLNQTLAVFFAVFYDAAV